MRSPSTCWRMHESTGCYILFLQKCYFAVWLSTDLFIVMERSSGKNFGRLRTYKSWIPVGFCLHERSTTRIICMFEIRTFPLNIVCYRVWFGTDLFIVLERSKDKTHVKCSGEIFGRLRMQAVWIGYCLHERSTTRVICMFVWDANYSFEYFVCYGVILFTFCIN